MITAADLEQREKDRALYAALASECEACISLSAPSAAPMGLQFDRRPELHGARLLSRHSGDLSAGVAG